MRGNSLAFDDRRAAPSPKAPPTKGTSSNRRRRQRTHGGLIFVCARGVRVLVVELDLARLETLDVTRLGGDPYASEGH